MIRKPAMTDHLSPISTLHALSRHRKGTRQGIRAFQDERLRRLVSHAYERVPYYGDLFDRQSLKPRDIGSVEDLPKIPIC